MRVFSRPKGTPGAFIAAALFVCLFGCGPKRAASTAGSVTLHNGYGGTCSQGERSFPAFTAALDQGPAVSVADGAQFEFANLSQGEHTLTLSSHGAFFQEGGEVWKRAFPVSAGAAYTVLITCGDNATVLVSLSPAP